MTSNTPWTEFPENDRRPRVMVVSHERSGTHFLMNTLALCFGYKAMPWVNFDNGSVLAHFYSPRGVQNLFEKLTEPAAINRPDRYRNVIMPTQNIDYEKECVFTEETFAFLQTVAGGLMRELGYDPSLPERQALPPRPEARE